MHRIDGPGATVGNLFTEGNPATAVPATVVTDDWLNDVQEELISILAAAGITPIKGDQNQVLAAIQGLIAESSLDLLNTARIDVASAGTVNLTVAAPATRHINITGTTAITEFTVASGQCYFVRFAGVLTLTNGAGLVTQTGANITTAAGDTCLIRATANNVVEVLCYVHGINQSIGYGQTWQDVTGSRALGTTYTNSTGRPIMVSVSRKKGANNMTVTVGGVVVARVEGYGLTDQDNICFVVPNGGTYLVTASDTPLGTWTELR